MDLPPRGQFMFTECGEGANEVQETKAKKIESCGPEGGRRAQEEPLPPSTGLSLQKAWPRNGAEA